MTYWIAPVNDPDIAARGTTHYGGGQLSGDDIEVACAGLFVVNAQHFADKDAV